MMHLNMSGRAQECLAAAFGEVEARREELGIADVQIAMLTLEDVFLTIAKDSEVEEATRLQARMQTGRQPECARAGAAGGAARLQPEEAEVRRRQYCVPVLAPRVLIERSVTRLDELEAAVLQSCARRRDRSTAAAHRPSGAGVAQRGRRCGRGRRCVWCARVFCRWRRVRFSLLRQHINRRCNRIRR